MNRKLCKRYPFIAIRDWKTGKPLKEWKYAFTELDNLPYGWRKAFGYQMLEEIRDILIKGNYLYKYRITQIKEKYGGLRWYDYCVPALIYDELQSIINKYEDLSYHTCIKCGRPATKISRGWISPFCDKCAEKLSGYMKFENIEEFYHNK